MWIKLKDASYQIISANVHHNVEASQVWVERPTGKSLKIFQSAKQSEADEIKNAIDFALKNNVPVLEL